MDFEFQILNYIQDHFRSGLMDALMSTVSIMGKLSWCWVVLAIILLIIKKTRKCGITLALDVVFNLVASSLIIKPLVSRMRPCVLNRTVQVLSSIPFDGSFPSGHTLFAFGAATVIFIYNKGLGLLAYLFACVMGFSRMYLYMHFPTDVLFGGILGIIFAVVVYSLQQSFMRKGGRRLKNAY